MTAHEAPTERVSPPAVPGTMAEQKPDGVVGALLALADLREAMKTVHLRVPWAPPDKGPTQYDACHQLLEHIEHCLRQLGIYLGDLEEPPT